MAKNKKKKNVKFQQEGTGKKSVKQYKVDSGKRVGYGESPDSYMKKRPTWNFSRADKECWTICESFIEHILPALISFEGMTWQEIVSASKGHGDGSKNHSVEISHLIKKAQDRLEMLHIHEDALMSLRLSGKSRLWGILDSGIFNILWYDAKHEICPSRLKHS